MGNKNNSVHSRNSKNIPRVATVSEIMQKRDNFYHRSWVLFNGEIKTMVNGEWISDAEFKERYPIPVFSKYSHNPENPNGNAIQ